MSEARPIPTGHRTPRHYITPVLWHSPGPYGQRIEINTVEPLPDRITSPITVTCRDTGKRYRLYRKSCGLPHCMCDARASLIEEEDERQ